MSFLTRGYSKAISYPWTWTWKWPWIGRNVFLISYFLSLVFITKCFNKNLLLRKKKLLVYFSREIASTAPAWSWGLVVFRMRDSGSKMKIHIENIIICSSYAYISKRRQIDCLHYVEFIFLALWLYEIDSGSIAILFVGELFQIWNSVFHVYSDQIDLWKISNTHVNMLVRLKLIGY